jgi:hypothetical protein
MIEAPAIPTVLKVPALVYGVRQDASPGNKAMTCAPRASASNFLTDIPKTQ